MAWSSQGKSIYIYMNISVLVYNYVCTGLDMIDGQNRAQMEANLSSEVAMIVLDVVSLYTLNFKVNIFHLRIIYHLTFKKWLKFKIEPNGIVIVLLDKGKSWYSKNKKVLIFPHHRLDFFIFTQDSLQKQDGDNNLMQRVFDLHLHFLQSSQSQHVQKNAFASLRAFINKVNQYDFFWLYYCSVTLY